MTTSRPLTLLLIVTVAVSACSNPGPPIGAFPKGAIVITVEGTSLMASSTRTVFDEEGQEIREASWPALFRAKTAQDVRSLMVSWSTDGEWMAYVEPAANDPFSSRVSIATKTGEGATVLDLPGINNTNPVWSPDGEWLAYTNGDATPENDGPRLYVVETGCVIRNLPCQLQPRLVATQATSPAWSPDGRQLAYSYYADDGIRITSAFGLTAPEEFRPGRSVICRHTQWAQDDRLFAICDGSSLYAFNLSAKPYTYNLVAQGITDYCIQSTTGNIAVTGNHEHDPLLSSDTGYEGGSTQQGAYLLDVNSSASTVLYREDDTSVEWLACVP